MTTEAINTLKGLKNLISGKMASKEALQLKSETGFYQHLKSEESAIRPKEKADANPRDRAMSERDSRAKSEPPQKERAQHERENRTNNDLKSHDRSTSERTEAGGKTEKRQANELKNDEAGDNEPPLTEETADSSTANGKLEETENKANLDQSQKTALDAGLIAEANGNEHHLAETETIETSAAALEHTDGDETGATQPPAAAIKAESANKANRGLSSVSGDDENGSTKPLLHAGHPQGQLKAKGDALASTLGEDGAEADLETTNGQNSKERGVSDIAKTIKDAPSAQDAAKALAAHNKESNAPILTAAGAEARGWMKQVGLPTAKGDVTQITKLDGADILNSTGTIADGKTPASQNTPRLQGTSGPGQTIALTIAAKAQNGVHQFEIRLNPPELGRVDVRLEFGRDGQMTTHLIVERPETLDMLNKDARNLERALQNAGLNLDEGSLSFSLKDQGSAGKNMADQPTAEHLKQSDDQKQNSKDEQALETPIYRAITSPGGLDISI